MDFQRKSIKSFAVIGLGFGDEGKGLTTNYLTKELKDAMVVRYSGGQQAGHTVVDHGISHIFSNFGSGTLNGAPTYWSKYCSFDPVGVKREWDILAKKSDRKVTLYVDRNAPVTTPYEKSYNKLFSKATKHGTCGVGVGATFKREEAGVSLLVGDLKYPAIVEMKLETIRNYYVAKTGYAMSTADDLDKFEKACAFVRDAYNIVISNNLLSKSHYIFEGSQGLLLDQNIGFFPHVTPSNTGTKNILELDKNRPYLYLVTRAYQTRHGNGPMTNEHIPHKIKDNANETNVKNEFQGNFRKTLLDLDLLKYAMDRDDYIRTFTTPSRGYKPYATLVITCLDHMVDDYRYTAGGKIIQHDDEKSFIKGISDFLGLSEVLVCDNPEGYFESYDFDQTKYLGEFG